MSVDTTSLGIGALVLSALITGAVRRLAVSRGVMDVPNERSSHSRATPRGGGVSIVLVCVVAWLILALAAPAPRDLLIALAGGGIAVALVGFADDLFSVHPVIRLAVHLGAAAWAVVWLGGLPPLQVGDHELHPGAAGYVAAVLGIVWVLNLFNFMDGIDGIAATEAVFVVAGAAGLTLLSRHADGLLAIEIVFVAACAGFLLWNWPPAKIFMGDVGSGFVGYVVAVLALAGSRSDPAAIWKWLILGGVFFTDATVTLVRRGLRGEPVHEAHRSHAYQWLARRWRSHKRVTLTVVLLNVVWVLPCAVLATLYPETALWMVLVAFPPLVLLALGVGAGRREPPRS